MRSQLSYSRRWRSTVFQAIAPHACYQRSTLDVIYVCVRVSGPLLRRGRGSRNQQHMFVLFRAFVSRVGGNKQNARYLFGPLLPKGGEFAQGGGPQKQTPAEFIRATALGRGVAKTETRATFVRASVAQEGGALNT